MVSWHPLCTPGGNSVMSDPRLVLTGMGPKLSGLTWETTSALRIGRHTAADLVIQDHSVERLHAEVRHHGMRWLLRDLARNPMYPTFVNDVALKGKDHVLQVEDVIRLGKL